ncbi:macrolide 2'-phosphotransferase [Litoribacter ruber]|uniref:macrolide 2'-phosphotransferase n=1 Tax=Litoribacter ruber TaxID=702568 RepID=UPI001BDA8B35|nr:macrolide 2'-phosphotransferase [Litoribacter ruber]MBT0810474.1 macrolide 2'-phosphotransferase [Litoribacter ruber]
MKIDDIQKLTKSNGLAVKEDLVFNDMGIDFKVVFATTEDGKKWLLRIPRRKDLGEQIEEEKKILELAGKYLSIQVPNWQIANSELVAYPLLEGKPALTFDAQTYEVSWNMDQNNPAYITSLAEALVQLHSIPRSQVEKSGLKITPAENLRKVMADRLELVKSELGLSKELESRYRKWLDNDPLWPDFTKFIHGDLYAGHVMVNESGEVTGIIDWSTAHIGDISEDFAGHHKVFGEDSLKDLIQEYEKQGGDTWDKLYEHTIERTFAAPLAYGYFAIQTQDPTHLQGAKEQLGK